LGFGAPLLNSKARAPTFHLPREWFLWDRSCLPAATRWCWSRHSDVVWSSHLRASNYGVWSSQTGRTEILRQNLSCAVPIEVICADAAVADLSEGTIYYIYNSFGVETLRDVLGNIRKFLSLRPRSIKIVYNNSVHEAVFQSCDWLEKFDSFNTSTRRRVTFWRNRSR
jgi:hypothetical protein